MQKVSSFVIIFVILIGCSGINIPDDQGLSELTPYITQEKITVAAETESSAIESSSPPVPTETPIIHVVALGETISSIALLYGLPIDEILKVNPEAKPNALIVGDQLVIPASVGQHLAALDPAILENIRGTTPNCIQTRDDGLWCAVFVENHGKENLENIVVTFSFKDSDETVVKERSAPALMRFASPDIVIPAVVFLETVPAKYSHATAKIFSAQIIDETISPYLTIVIEEETHAIDGREAVISGSMRVEADQEKDRADISIGAAAFDANGTLVGVRRIDRSVATNETFNFHIRVYSSTDSIAQVTLYTEAY